MSAKERHETRLAILVSVIVIAGLMVYAITHIVQ